MKRQRGRNRNGGGSSNGGGAGSGKPQHNVNRAFDSNGPDGVKIRGHAQHVFEKYSQLARDASAAGDRVLGENYLQHAEHYFRLIRAVQPQRPASDIIGRDLSSGYDIDFEDESNNVGMDDSSDMDSAEAETNGDQRQDRGEWRGDRQDNRGFDNRNPDTRNQDNRNQDNRGQDNRAQDNRGQDARTQDGRGFGRDDRPRDDRPRDDRRRDEPRAERQDRPRDRDRNRFDRNGARDPMAVVEPEAAPLAAAVEDSPQQPQLRSQDGSLSPAPAFLQPRADTRPEAAIETPEEDRPRRPRRRRAPRTFEGADGEAAKPESETEEA